MHLEVLVEDSSSARLLEYLLPLLLGDPGSPHTWRVHAYRGVGRIPVGLGSKTDPSKRILLDRLPKLLRGYGNSPGIDAVVVLIDTDERDCKAFLRQLKRIATTCAPAPTTLFRLAIEEVEAWYLGDRAALKAAYPRLKSDALKGYTQDGICGTWEILADAVYPGGSAALRKAGWPLPGQVKHEWAERIGPRMVLDRNKSTSFRKFVDGVRRLASST